MDHALTSPSSSTLHLVTSKPLHLHDASSLPSMEKRMWALQLSGAMRTRWCPSSTDSAAAARSEQNTPFGFCSPTWPDRPIGLSASARTLAFAPSVPQSAEIGTFGFLADAIPRCMAQTDPSWLETAGVVSSCRRQRMRPKKVYKRAYQVSSRPRHVMDVLKHWTVAKEGQLALQTATRGHRCPYAPKLVQLPEDRKGRALDLVGAIPPLRRWCIVVLQRHSRICKLCVFPSTHASSTTNDAPNSDIPSSSYPPTFFPVLSTTFSFSMHKVIAGLSH
ncbi:hypothetical protein B0T10DRAFT_215900 [Thelonectria olida]|uniref:Uncharacterized protein n=1 Tax=Thelonectria olida TaxID=1576542 RepID=A0A9P9ATP0_9HYPO|nr:hypothetical protein B0T10DRAFT_215900 [Thelonectria olida]